MNSTLKYFRERCQDIVSIENVFNHVKSMTWLIPLSQFCWQWKADMCGLIVPDGGNAIEIMPSKMEVASQHCDTVPNKTKDIFDTVKIERIF